MCTDFYIRNDIKKGWLLATVLLAASMNAGADESGASTQWSRNAGQSSASQDFVQTYALGVGEYETDDFTTVTGWRISDSWHLGYQDGEDSGLSLVWQKSRDQISFSHNGLRFTRRF